MNMQLWSNPQILNHLSIFAKYVDQEMRTPSHSSWTVTPPTPTPTNESNDISTEVTSNRASIQHAGKASQGPIQLDRIHVLLPVVRYFEYPPVYWEFLKVPKHLIYTHHFSYTHGREYLQLVKPKLFR